MNKLVLRTVFIATVCLPAALNAQELWCQRAADDNGLREGDNEFVIEVANTWVNRLIGDEAPARFGMGELANPEAIVRLVYSNNGASQRPLYLYIYPPLPGRRPASSCRITKAGVDCIAE